jgi:hypothetical protein
MAEMPKNQNICTPRPAFGHFGYLAKTVGKPEA